jgi:hypothetical protein
MRTMFGIRRPITPLWSRIRLGALQAFTTASWLAGLGGAYTTRQSGLLAQSSSRWSDR